MPLKKGFPFLILLLCFILQSCAGPPKPAISQVPIREVSEGTGSKEETRKDSTWGSPGIAKENRGNLAPAVKQVTLPPRPESAAPVINATPARKDSIRVRFPGKKVVFPDELPLPDRKPEYRIGADDVISVLVWNQPDLTLPNVTVRKDGIFSFFSTVKEKLWGGANFPGRLSC